MFPFDVLWRISWLSLSTPLRLLVPNPKDRATAFPLGLGAAPPFTRSQTVYARRLRPKRGVSAEMMKVMAWNLRQQGHGGARDEKGKEKASLHFPSGE